MSLHPWASGPFELILHAEQHYQAGDDRDRRIALIGFDNAIEVAITTYLSLHPIQRGNKEYVKKDVDIWLQNYHTKLEFFESECGQRKLEIKILKSHMIWYHGIRNNQYHGGTPLIPNKDDLKGVREAALWVFATLYDVPDVEQILETRYAELSGTNNAPPVPDVSLDRAIDATHGMVEVGGVTLYASEVLFNYDPIAYKEIGLELLEKTKTSEGGE
jgi:hypothetical protein